MKLICSLLLITVVHISNNIAFSQDKEYCNIQVIIPKDCSCNIQEIKEKGEFNLLIEDTSYVAPQGEKKPMIESGLEVKFNQSGIYLDSILMPSTFVLYSIVYRTFDKKEIILNFSIYPQFQNDTIYLQCDYFDRKPPLFMNDLEKDKFISFATNITNVVNPGTSYEEKSIFGCEIIQFKKENGKIYAYYKKSYDLKNDNINIWSFCDCNYNPNSGFQKSIVLNRKQMRKLKQYQKSIIEQYHNNLKSVVQRNVAYNEINNKNVYFYIDQDNFELLKDIFWTNNNIAK